MSTHQFVRHNMSFLFLQSSMDAIFIENRVFLQSSMDAIFIENRMNTLLNPVGVICQRISLVGHHNMSLLPYGRYIYRKSRVSSVQYGRYIYRKHREPRLEPRRGDMSTH